MRRPGRRLLMTICLAAAPAAWAPAAQALPPCDSAPCASDTAPVAILAYYRTRTLTRLTIATIRAKLPAGTPVYYGSYWGVGVNTRPPLPPPPPPRRKRPPMPGGRFAPIFSLARTNFWDRRELTAAQIQQLPAAERDAFPGKVPSLERLMRRNGAYRYAAGLEVGRRFRDRIRRWRAKGKQVVTWQFDELPATMAGRDGGKLRQVLKGLLRGVAYGRPALGDVKLPGITWAARGALTARSGGDGLRRFWEAVDDTSLYLVGEEYPEFTGPPLRAARKAAAAQRAIYRWGDAGVSLGGKYVAGLTPGYELATGFGGNVRHRPRRAVEHWRLGYIRARAADGVAGFAEYNFNDRNALGGVMDDVLRALGKGVRLLLASRA